MTSTPRNIAKLKSSSRPIWHYVAGIILLGAVVAALIAALYVHGHRFRDICDSDTADTECRLLCHPEERHARRVLLTIGRVPLTLKTCVDMAAGVGSGTIEASVASCIKEVGSADRDALSTYTKISERLSKPSADLIAAWERRCQPNSRLSHTLPDLSLPSHVLGKEDSRDANKRTSQGAPGPLAPSTRSRPPSEVQTYTTPGEAERRQNESQ